MAPIFDRFVTYIEGFLACAEICILARWMDPNQRDDSGPGQAGITQLASALDRLDAFVVRIRPVTESAALSHQLVMLMDYRRATDIAREGRQILQGKSYA